MERNALFSLLRLTTVHVHTPLELLFFFHTTLKLCHWHLQSTVEVDTIRSDLFQPSLLLELPRSLLHLRNHDHIVVARLLLIHSSRHAHLKRMRQLYAPMRGLLLLLLSSAVVHGPRPTQARALTRAHAFLTPSARATVIQVVVGTSAPPACLLLHYIPAAASVRNHIVNIVLVVVRRQFLRQHFLLSLHTSVLLIVRTKHGIARSPRPTVFTSYVITVFTSSLSGRALALLSVALIATPAVLTEYWPSSV